MRREMDEMNLTAYALGELEGAERATVEARLLASPQDRQFVDEVRAAAQLVSDELSRETNSGLDAIHYAAIEMRLREPGYVPRVDRRAVVRGRIGLALSVAASIAIVCGVFGAVFILSRHHQLASTSPTTLPTNTPILIPLEHLNLGGSVPGHGIAQVPAGGGPFVNAADQPVSSFAMNTDTASYEDLRHALFSDRLPSRESVRIESMVNAFDYDYAAPVGNAAFAGQIEIGTCPWQPEHRLARIAVKARPGAGTVAEDVRTEVAFNPAQTKSYRLLGYDEAAVDAAPAEGITGGHAVTALYEVVPVATEVPSTDMLTLRIHYRQPNSAATQSLQFIGRDVIDGKLASADFRFAAAVAEFALILREPSEHKAAKIDAVIQMAEAARGPDVSGERQQFVELVQRAKVLLG
jgi:hypothetical protein